MVWPKPQALDFEAAAGFLVVHLTAYHGFLQNVVVRPGMRVLVHSPRCTGSKPVFRGLPKGRCNQMEATKGPLKQWCGRD